MSADCGLSHLRSYDTDVLKLTYPNLQRLPESRFDASDQSDWSSKLSTGSGDPSIRKAGLSSLPLEIRLEIYYLLFGDLTIVLLPNKSMARHVPHHYKHRSNQAQMALTHRLVHTTAYTSTSTSASPFAFDKLENRRAASSLRFFLSTTTSSSTSLLLNTSLLAVSHQLYHEITPLLYTHATFRVQSSHLFNFIHHRTPAQLHHIRRLAVSEILCSKLEARTFRHVMVAAAGALVQVRELQLELQLGPELWIHACKKRWKVGWVQGVRAWAGMGLVVVGVRLEGVQGVQGEAEGRGMELLGRALEEGLRAGVPAGSAEGNGGGEGGG
ncbi:hypothetical protein MMC17_000352 [Xylographa soralifera]|nr:hypothetical protein [Xylographa soralifera]